MYIDLSENSPSSTNWPTTSIQPLYYPPPTLLIWNIVVLFILFVFALDLGIQYLITKNKKMKKPSLILFGVSVPILIIMLLTLLLFSRDLSSVALYTINSLLGAMAIYALLNIPYVIYMHIKKMERKGYQIVKIVLLLIFSFYATMLINFSICCG